MLDPDMPAQELRLHMGELTANEMRVARAAIRWANAAFYENSLIADNITRSMGKHFKNCKEVRIKIEGVEQ